MTGHPALIASAELAARLGDPAIRILDASFHVPTSGRNAAAEHAAARLPGARFFDIDRIADRTSPLPHMLPSPEDFAAAIAALGVGAADEVVVYDQPGSAGSARAWWTFRVFGFDRVSVLDGGLARWRREGRPIVEGPPPAADAPLPAPPFVPEFRRRLVRSADDMRANLAAPREQVIDARGPGRFAGVEPEPRPAPRLGHIPGAVNLPFTSLLESPERDNAWRSTAEILARFAEAGVDLRRPITSYCGSGVTACAPALAAYLAAGVEVAVYDGSWAEWGALADAPVER